MASLPAMPSTALASGANDRGMDTTADFVHWLNDAGRAERTVAHYRWVLAHYRRWLGRDPLDATPDEARDWLAQYHALSPETRRSYRSVLASYYRWAVDQAELRDRSPMVKVPTVRVPPAVPRPLSPLEVQRILGPARGRMRAWLLLGLDAGLRRSEMAAVEGGHIVGRRLHVHGKGGRHRAVPLSHRLIAELDQWSPTHGRLWPITGSHLGNLVSEHMTACGVHSTPHSLRHTFATAFYQASGHDLRRTQHVLGHASPSTTARYVGFEDDLDEIVDRMAA